MVNKQLKRWNIYYMGDQPKSIRCFVRVENNANIYSVYFTGYGKHVRDDKPCLTADAIGVHWHPVTEGFLLPYQSGQMWSRTNPELGKEISWNHLPEYLKQEVRRCYNTLHNLKRPSGLDRKFRIRVRRTTHDPRLFDDYVKQYDDNRQET